MDTGEIRKRDAEATRERILDCAKLLFSEKGFDAASIREIAACAAVNSALVARYFGSKKELFEHAILPEFDISQLLELSDENFAAQVAELFASKPPKQGFDPMMALLNSLGSEEVGGLVQSTLTDRVIKPLSEKLGGASSEARAAVLISQLAGFDLFRRMIKIDVLTQTPPSELRAILEKSIISLLE